MPIYTRAGDSGETSLNNGLRIKKNNLRIVILGNIDELNSCLGLTHAFLVDYPQLKEVDQLLELIQKVLYEIASEIAGNSEYSLPNVHTDSLEEAIEFYQTQLPTLTRFIRPSGTKPAAFLHYSRTLCRRVERLITHLGQKEPINPELLRFTNRLSDLLFVLARFVNQETGGAESYLGN